MQVLAMFATFLHDKLHAEDLISDSCLTPEARLPFSDFFFEMIILTPYFAIGKLYRRVTVALCCLPFLAAARPCPEPNRQVI